MTSLIFPHSPLQYFGFLLFKKISGPVKQEVSTKPRRLGPKGVGIAGLDHQLSPEVCRLAPWNEASEGNDPALLPPLSHVENT